jgi:hypothetical protein
MRVRDMELLIETREVSIAGSQPTSVLGEASKRVMDGFDRAQEAIVAVASSVAETVHRLQQQAAHPHRMEVEFGLKFSVEGDVLVASASGEATLRVLVSYQAPSHEEK